MADTKKLTKLQRVMKDLGIKQIDLYHQIEKNIEGTDDNSVGITNINKIVCGKQQDALTSTLVKITKALNDLRRIRGKFYGKPITIDDIIY